MYSRKQAGITSSVEPIIVFQIVKIIAAEPEPVVGKPGEFELIQG